MNLQRLKLVEKQFLQLYPGGFDNPEILNESKKHRGPQMTAMAQEMFAPEKFENSKQIALDMSKIISRSSVVSVFEKPRFRDFIESLSPDECQTLSKALYEQLHGNEKKGFNSLIKFLQPEKLAKWTLITIIQAYYYPAKEVFIKPTTVKNIINFFDIENITYSATPTYDFYSKYRDTINELKTHTHKSLQPNNLAFSGFLMLSM
ncbi:MAG: hypothetical protein WCH76_04650 [Candidatus Riflemargulisbacteria bacterium]